MKLSGEQQRLSDAQRIVFIYRAAIFETGAIRIPADEPCWTEPATGMAAGVGTGECFSFRARCSNYGPAWVLFESVFLRCARHLRPTPCVLMARVCSAWPDISPSRCRTQHGAGKPASVLSGKPGSGLNIVALQGIEWVNLVHVRAQAACKSVSLGVKQK